MTTAISTRQKAAVATTQVVNLAALTPAEDKVVVLVENRHAKLTVWRHHLQQRSCGGSATLLSTDVRELPRVDRKNEVVGSLRSCDGDHVPLWMLTRTLRRAGIDPKYVWVEVIG